MKFSGWKYYNHAMLPTCLPHENVDTSQLSGNCFWKENKNALLARWTTDFDCNYETNWWYIIKDTVFDISALKAKRRYVINKGLKNFDIRIINACEYKNELFEVQKNAFSAYPKKYRPTVHKESFFKHIESLKDFYVVFGAFLKTNGKLCGYAYIKENGKCLSLNVLKTDPDYEKLEVNAAIVHYMLNHFKERLQKGFYICDGERSINHETAFQDYLIKYFDFRKAYCKLNVIYNPKIKWLIKVIYPFRNIIKQFDNIGIIHNLNSLLKIEKIVRENRNTQARL